MALSLMEIDLIERMKRDLDDRSSRDELLFRYYDAEHRVQQLGMAVPPDMRHFEVVTDGPRVVVDTRVDRQQVRALVLPGEESLTRSFGRSGTGRTLMRMSRCSTGTAASTAVRSCRWARTRAIHLFRSSGWSRLVRWRR